MKFLNNWRRPIELAAGELSCPLDLPDGEYRLTLSDADSSRWEIIDAWVEAGSGELVRGVEGTDEQDWPAGSVIYCSITAEQIDSVFAKLSDLQIRAAGLEVRVAALEATPLLSIRLLISNGVDGGSFRWLYAVRAMAGGDEAAFISAEQLADLNDLFYSSEHWSGAPTAGLPSSAPGDYLISLGMSADPGWTHLALERGGDLRTDSYGETIVLADADELGRVSWIERSGSDSYATRYIDVIPLS